MGDPTTYSLNLVQNDQSPNYNLTFQLTPTVSGHKLLEPSKLEPLKFEPSKYENLLVQLEDDLRSGKTYTATAPEIQPLTYFNYITQQNKLSPDHQSENVGWSVFGGLLGAGTGLASLYKAKSLFRLFGENKTRLGFILTGIGLLTATSFALFNSARKDHNAYKSDIQVQNQQNSDFSKAQSNLRTKLEQLKCEIVRLTNVEQTDESTVRRESNKVYRLYQDLERSYQTITSILSQQKQRVSQQTSSLHNAPQSE